MPAASFRRLFSLLLFVFLQTNHSSFAQTAAFPVRDWVKKLSAKNAPLFSGVSEILSAIANEDSVHAMQKFKELETNGNASNRYFICRVNLVMGMYFRDHRAPRKLVNDIMTKAIIAAYETDNDSLVSALSWQYGVMSYWSGNMELASMYSLNAAEIDEKIGRKIPSGSYAVVISGTKNYL